MLEGVRGMSRTLSRLQCVGARCSLALLLSALSTSSALASPTPDMSVTDLQRHGREAVQAQRFGATFEIAHLDRVELGAHPIKLHTSIGEIHTRTLIVASGASARWLGIPSEQALIGHGVSSCATCDGFFFRGKEIAVVGGGDSAMEEALFLTRFATKVTLLHRREQFRASKIMLERAIAHPNIEFRTNTAV